MQEEQTPELITHLKNLGFLYIGREAFSWMKFQGYLHTSQGKYACDFFVDHYFIKQPIIYLTPVPEKLKPISPHIGSSGNICYLAEGTVILDMFNPLEETVRCLRRAEFVLDSILKNEMVKDLQDEFFVYWGEDCCFYDATNHQNGKLFSLVADKVGALIVTDNISETEKKFATLGLDISQKNYLTFRIKTHVQPQPIQHNWPPKNVGDILRWQSLLDVRCRRKIEERIDDAYKSKYNGVIIIICSPQANYGFYTIFNRKVEAKNKKT